MTHLELANSLTDYLEGALPASEARKLEAHLRECAACSTMVEDVRYSISVCRQAGEVEPPPSLLPRILVATTGERRPSFTDKVAAWLAPLRRPQFAYSLSMAVFSLSFILYAANIHLRGLRLSDANPAHWIYRADSRGHMLVARAEKYYYDLRFVYEMQSILHDLRQAPSSQPGAPKHTGPQGSSSSAQWPGDESELASRSANRLTIHPPMMGTSRVGLRELPQAIRSLIL